MLKINGKVFMNLQEAVQWLLDNNALPFQSSANYIANTEIGLGTIVNPSPAKVRIGSLIFFADSKVSTVIGLTENGFMVSDQYNDLVDDVVYVSNVALDGSGHLIVTLSNGDTIDAGLIKQVTGFSIDGSQHLIVTFNDGTSTDLGAIFNGNMTVSGNMTVTGDMVVNGEMSGTNISKVIEGYFSSIFASLGLTEISTFIKVVRNFNELQFIMNFRVKNETGADVTVANDNPIVYFPVPAEYRAKIYAHNGNNCEAGNQGPIAMSQLFVTQTGGGVSSANTPRYVDLYHSGTNIYMYLEGGTVSITSGETLDFETRISLAL